MLQNLRIRWKLVVIFLLPALTLLLVAGGRMLTTVSTGQKADAERRVLVFSGHVGDFITQLQEERSLSVQYIGTGRRSGADQLAAQRSKVDVAIVAYQTESEALAPDSSDR